MGLWRVGLRGSVVVRHRRLARVAASPRVALIEPLEHAMQDPQIVPATDGPTGVVVGGASRRRFLAAAAGTAAGAALAGAAAKASAAPAVRAQPGKIPKAKARTALKDGDTIRIGIIGVGGPGQGSMGTGHAQAFTTLAKKGLENCKIVAVCDVNQFNLEYALAKLPEWGKRGEGESGDPVVTAEDVKGYRDFRELLAREDIHGVIVASPEHWHAQMAIEALAAGKDVYLEKPMTLRLEEALRLREVVMANPDLRLQVGTQMTNLPKYHEARKLINEGALGTITFSQTSYCRNNKDGEWNYYVLKPDQKRWPGAEWKPGENLDWDMWCGPLGKQAWDPKLYSRWRRYRRTSTGILGDLLPHVITPMLVALGESVGWPTYVTATGQHLVDKEMENHDNVHIAVVFENGHQMFIAGSTCNEAGLEPMIRGHRANVYLSSRHCELRPERLYAEEIEPRRIECPDIGNDQDVHRLKWMKCIRTREQPDSDVHQGAKVMTIIDLATRAIWDGGAWSFDPKTMTAKKA